jgi:hypothetical protein
MQKIKQFVESEKGKDVLIVIIVILVGLASFELGRLSKGNTSSGIKIEYTGGMQGQGANLISSIGESSSLLQKTATPANASGKNFFASNRGTKYYSAGCSAGKSLKQENRIYFDTKEAAEKAGYELSSSCR